MSTAGVGTGAGIAGGAFNYVVRQRDARVELYIDTREDDENQCKFEELFRKKERIEDAFGLPLEWDPKEGRRTRPIKKTYAGDGYRDEYNWEAMYEKLAEPMAKLESALKQNLKKP